MLRDCATRTGSETRRALCVATRAPIASCSYKRVKGRSHTVEKRKARVVRCRDERGNMYISGSGLQTPPDALPGAFNK